MQALLRGQVTLIQNLSFSLKPIIYVEAMHFAALLVEFIGSTHDLLMQILRS